MKKRITITEEDIALGIPRLSSSCAIAMALQREYPMLAPQVVPFMEGNEMRHRVHLFELQGNIEPFQILKQSFVLSKNASKAIAQFDNVGVMVPATYEMTEIER